MITARGIEFAYGPADVLTAVGLTAAPDEVVGLIGPNGSGKSTLLKVLYGALHARAGEVTLDQAPLATLSPRRRAREIAVVVQEEAAGDLPFTVTDIVGMGRTPHLGSLQRYSTTDRRAVWTAMERVGITELAGRVFSGLSGGEKQRALIARALAQEASHLLLDEPTNHLDIRYQHEILHLVGGLGVTTVIVLHDLNLAARYCTRLVLLEAGRVVATGTPAEVLDPQVVGPVYGITVERVDHAGVPQLMFTRRATD